MPSRRARHSGQCRTGRSAWATRRTCPSAPSAGTRCLTASAIAGCRFPPGRRSGFRTFGQLLQKIMPRMTVMFEKSSNLIRLATAPASGRPCRLGEHGRSPRAARRNALPVRLWISDPFSASLSESPSSPLERKSRRQFWERRDSAFTVRAAFALSVGQHVGAFGKNHCPLTCPISSRISTLSLCRAAMPSSPLSVARQLRTCSGPPQTEAAIWRAVVLPDDEPPSKLNPPPSRPAGRSNGPAKAAHRREAQSGIADGQCRYLPPAVPWFRHVRYKTAVLRGLQHGALRRRYRRTRHRAGRRAAFVPAGAENTAYPPERAGPWTENAASFDRADGIAEPAAGGQGAVPVSVSLPEQHFHGHGPCVLVGVRVNPFQHQAPFVAVSCPASCL